MSAGLHDTERERGNYWRWIGRDDRCPDCGARVIRGKSSS